MTPFGEKLRALRAERGLTQKEMAVGIGVSAAYLSALENGKRGKPSWPLQQRIFGFLNIIWDEAEELENLARLSEPRAIIDTSGLGAKATMMANLLAQHIDDLDEDSLEALKKIIQEKSRSKQ